MVCSRSRYSRYFLLHLQQRITTIHSTIMTRATNQVHASQEEHDCPFCNLAKDRLIYSDSVANIFADGYPIAPGHLLITPKIHHRTIFDVPACQQAHLFSLINKAKSIICQSHSPDGYNIGINNGEAAGQTVHHVHIHVIPRYEGDVDNPRGGVRWVMPEKAKYWK